MKLQLLISRRLKLCLPTLRQVLCYLDEVALVPYVDKAELITLLSEALNQESYSVDEWNAILLLIDEGWALATSASATQEAVNEMAASLEGAIIPGTHPIATLTGPAKIAAGDRFDMTYGLSRYEGSALAIDSTVTFDHNKLEFIAPVS